ELSGGLDSSTISALSYSLGRQNALPAPSFETFSLAFADLPSDERDYIQHVVQMLNIKSNAVYPKVLETINSYAEEVIDSYDFPNYPNGVMHVPLLRLARDKGARVLLTGLGGDHLFSGSLLHYADFIQNFRILSFIRQVYYDCFDTYYIGVDSILRSF